MKTRLSRHKKGNLGGYLVGKSHRDGGIPIVNKSNPNQNIEVEGEEVIINAKSVKSKKRKNFQGRMMTNREILSTINSEDGNGVSFAKGGTVPKSIRCTGRMYNYGGKLLSDYEIVHSCGCKHSGKMSMGGNIPPAVSEEVLKKEGNRIAKRMKTDKGYEIIDSDPETFGSTWSAGGCYPFARAMQKIFGGRLVFIYDKGIAQHVMLNIGKMYFDSDGVSDIEKKYEIQISEGGIHPRVGKFEKKKLGEIAIGSEALVNRIVEFATEKKMYNGGPMPNENELLEEISKIQYPEKHFFYEYTKDPKAFLAFIQDQATGMNAQRTSAHSPGGAYNDLAKIIGNEDLVLRCVAALPQDKKEMIKAAWYNKVVPLKLRRAITAKKLQSGGNIPDTELTPDQIWVLRVYKGYKPQFRKDHIAIVLEDHGKYKYSDPRASAKLKADELIQQLKSLGFITSQNALSDKGKQYLEKAMAKWNIGSSLPATREEYENYWLPKFSTSLEDGGPVYDGRLTIPIAIPHSAEKNSTYYQFFKNGGLIKNRRRQAFAIPFPKQNDMPVSLVNEQSESKSENRKKIGLFAPHINLTYDNDEKIPARIVKDTKDVFDFFWEIWDKEQIKIVEQAYLLYLNHNNKILGYYDLSKGGITGTVVDPRIIVATAASAGATKVILAHNHPSGGLEPSRADRLVTVQIGQALQVTDTQLLDHMIITPDKNYYSFGDNGILEFAKGGKIKSSNPNDITQKEFAGMMNGIRPFVPDFQLKYLIKLFNGEERQGAVQIVETLLRIIKQLPRTYQTEKQEIDDKIVYLHYFYGGSDWYIIEKDKGSKDDDQPGYQHQTYGYAILNGDIEMAEWGYISIEEIKQTNKIELDFHFEPRPFGKVKAKWETQGDNDEIEQDQAAGPEYEYVGGKGNSLDLVKFSDFATARKYLDEFMAAGLLKDYDVLQVYPEFASDKAPAGYYLSKYHALGKSHKDSGTYLTRGVFESNLNILNHRESQQEDLLEHRYEQESEKVMSQSEDRAEEQLQNISSFKDQSVIVTLTPNEAKKYDELEDANHHAGALELVAGISEWSQLLKAAKVLVSELNNVGHMTPGLKKLADRLSAIIKIQKLGTFNGENLTTYRKANKKERQTIIEKFGENLLPAVEQVLGDVIELNPHHSKVRLSKMYEDLSFNVIGASASKDNFSYIMTDEGIIYLEHNFSLFPADDKKIKAQQSVVIESSQQSTISVKKQIEINKQIRELVKQKGITRSKYSAEELALLELYEGAGYEKKTSTDARILDQFFTPMDICARMWGLAIKHGFTWGQSILEPAVGTGRFLKFIPADAKGYVRAYDVDEITYTISKVLYPQFDIRHKSFETEFFKGRRHIGLAGVTNFFDLVIGNPPYREYVSEYAPLGEKEATGAFTFEMYFIGRGIDVLRSGGLLCYIIPNTFLSNDKKYNDFKEKLNKKCTLIDGYRLPNGVFGNTDVGTDIILLRKND